jgi:exoribonuclease R
MVIVLVKLEDWPKKADSPFGSVIKVLGNQANTIEIHAILVEYGLPYSFLLKWKLLLTKLILQ